MCKWSSDNTVIRLYNFMTEILLFNYYFKSCNRLRSLNFAVEISQLISKYVCTIKTVTTIHNIYYWHFKEYMH